MSCLEERSVTGLCFVVYESDSLTYCCLSKVSSCGQLGLVQSNLRNGLDQDDTSACKGSFDAPISNAKGRIVEGRRSLYLCLKCLGRRPEQSLTGRRSVWWSLRPMKDSA